MRSNMKINKCLLLIVYLVLLFGCCAFETCPNCVDNCRDCWDYSTSSCSRSSSYQGYKDVTWSGIRCKPWFHTRFPDEPSDYCRLPDPWNSLIPYCYTDEPGVLWQYCFKSCANLSSCYNSDLDCWEDRLECQSWDAGYIVNRTRTLSGAACTPWADSNRNDPNLISNYCATPDGDQLPWCYTRPHNGAWESCFKLCKPTTSTSTTTTMPTTTVTTTTVKATTSTSTGTTTTVPIKTTTSSLPSTTIMPWDSAVIVAIGGFDGDNIVKSVEALYAPFQEWKPLPDVDSDFFQSPASCVNLTLLGFSQDRSRVPNNIDFVLGSDYKAWHRLANFSISAQIGGSATESGGMVYLAGCTAMDDTEIITILKAMAAKENNGLEFGGAKNYWDIFIQFLENKTKLPEAKRDIGQTPDFVAYDLATDSLLSNLAQMNISRVGAGMATLHGDVYICGGINFTKLEIEKSCEVYSVSSNTWRFIRPMSHPRQAPGLVAYEDRLYVFGGDENSTVEYYNPAVDEWLPLGNVPLVNLLSTMSFAMQDRVCIAGGWFNDEVTAEAICYDLKLGYWVGLPRMNTPRFGHGLAVCNRVVK